MDFISPSPRRLGLLGLVGLLAALAACAGRIPVLVPPSGGVAGVEGFGSASMRGEDVAVKGKFAFLFRGPGLGRVEAVDPIGRTAFLVIFREDRAYFVVPGKKAYAEDGPEAMMKRFLGISLPPDEVLRLLSGTWADAGAGGGWHVEQDERGRVSRGGRDGFAFTVREFFPGAGVPRDIGLSGPGTSGRLKILKLGFNPPLREAAFDVSFLRGYALKTWAEILELPDR
jgi:outer membrane biogenesis lipoprotein LolB